MSAHKRALAVVSLIATGGLILVVVVFLINNAVDVFLAIAGVIVALAGGWWFVTERMPRRAIGAIGLLLGIGLVVWAIVRAAGGTERIVLRLVVALAILCLAVVTARAAIAADLRDEFAGHFRKSSRPSRPVLICNPWSGGGKVEKFGLIELAGSMGVETVLLDHGLDLEQLARDAVRRGADCIGMAGGDGSQALVASIAVEHDLPFVCISAGTRNHFALDLGLDRNDPRHSMVAFRDALERRVDYAMVNGRFFVNNVSLGVYATIVQEEGYRDSKKDTTKELLPELLGRTEQPFDLQFTAPDGEEVDGSFLIMVSNNPYVLAASPDMSQRRRIDSGLLGVFAITATTGSQAARVVALALAGRSALSGNAYEFSSDHFEVRSRSGKAFAGIDGEALELETPMRFEIFPQGLRLLVPGDNADVSLKRAAHELRVTELASIILGSKDSG
ncbi:MAG TPA: diacylglycerol kinase family protein [Acidimicrobiales bacterium]|nr:diacylglycerol kinase family protein [Acidimicrobiales bacterium]